MGFTEAFFNAMLDKGESVGKSYLDAVRGQQSARAQALKEMREAKIKAMQMRAEQGAIPKVGGQDASLEQMTAAFAGTPDAPDIQFESPAIPEGMVPKTASSKGVVTYGPSEASMPAGKTVLVDRYAGTMTDAATGKPVTNIVKGIDTLVYKGISPQERLSAQQGVIPGAEAGRYALAKMSIDNIETVKKLLFPTGKPRSFRSDLALKSKVPGLGRPYPKDEQAQEVFRNMSDSLGGKVLIQTGVAARPEEVTAEYKKFYANYFSNPQSAWNGLNKLQEFYKKYMDLVSTRRDPGNTLPASAAPQAIQFDSVEEAEAANLPPGTEILINGERAVVE